MGLISSIGGHGKMNKKGITPVIAIVLLLMMTVSSAAAAYYWMTTIQSNLQQQAQGSISSTGLGGGYQISALAGGITCEAGASGNITVYLTNTGSNNIDSGIWYAFVKDSVGAAVGTWNSAATALNSGATSDIDFINGTSTMTASTQYTVQINSPKGTSATTSCTAS